MAYQPKKDYEEAARHEPKERGGTMEDAPGLSDPRDDALRPESAPIGQQTGVSAPQIRGTGKAAHGERRKKQRGGAGPE